jgi:predicted nucleotide-binding protein
VADPSSPDTEVLVVHDGITEAEDLVEPYLMSLGLTVSAWKQEVHGTEIMARLENTAVGFAVVLLTAQPAEGSSTPADAAAEPSRETIFGLGYALGRLGEDRVCALKVGNVVEPPSMPSLHCLPLDSADQWKFLLAKELRGAGFAITVRAAARGDVPRK